MQGPTERRPGAADRPDGSRSRLTGPHLVGVGVGPGDPALVTGRAVDVLAGADRIVAASMGPQAIGRAEAVVRAAVPGATVDRVTVDIAGGPDERAGSLRAAADELVAWLDAGEAVAFATLGDPNLWSTFPALARLVSEARPGVPVTAVPGVMAFQELAARTGTVVADDPGQVVVLAARDDVAPLDAALTDPDAAVVLCKGGARLPALARRLEQHGRLDGSVVGEHLGLPGERAVAVAEVADRPASYLATVVVPARPPGAPRPPRPANAARAGARAGARR